MSWKEKFVIKKKLYYKTLNTKIKNQNFVVGNQN